MNHKIQQKKQSFLLNSPKLGSPLDVRAGRGRTAGERLLQCSACCQASYCSTACQKLHWKLHRNDCRPFKLSAVPGKGLGLVAARNIKQGERIIREKPILVKMKSDQKNSSSLLDQFTNLSKNRQEELLELHHEATGPVGEKIASIFALNGCEIRQDFGLALYQTIAR